MLAIGSFREPVGTVEPDEMSAGDVTAPCQSLWLLLEQNHRLLTARAYRLDELSAGGELLRKGCWY